MCVAIPGRIVWIGESGDASTPARIETGDTVRDVDLVMVTGATVGDYVITHSGYAIKVIPAATARGTLQLLGIDQQHPIADENRLPAR